MYMIKSNTPTRNISISNTYDAVLKTKLYPNILVIKLFGIMDVNEKIYL